jgi:hypothetical protein
MDKQIIKKIALIVAALLLIAFVVWIIVKSASKDDEVKNREYDKAEVEAAASVLIEDSKLLNYIYWGKGIPYVDDKSLSSGSYYPADENYLNTIGIKTINDLKALTEKTYSKGMCEWIYSTVLSSVHSDTSVAGLSRYEQVYSGKNNDVPEYIRVYTEANYWLVDEVEYHPSVEALRSEGETVYVLILVSVTSPEGKVMNTNLEIGLVEEEDGWRLDSPTYARYYEDYTS